MSHGFACRNCGYYESAHEDIEVGEEWMFNFGVTADDVLPGYTMSYTACCGYESEDPRAEAAVIEAEQADELLKGEIMRQQAVIMMAYDPSGRRPPILYVADDWRG